MYKVNEVLEKVAKFGFVRVLEDEYQGKVVIVKVARVDNELLKVLSEITGKITIIPENEDEMRIIIRGLLE